ncbi:MAG TPA: ATP-binding protein [Anaerolineales bacterium]|nr:ATP-binding protein [Anaerolineales bacterium]
MNTWKKILWLIIERMVPWLVLAILLFYTYAKFFGHPYGFRWGSSEGVIRYVFIEQPEPTLQENDRIVQIGDVTWEEFREDLRRTFFDGAKPGDLVPITVLRDDERIDISWVYPGFNWNEFQEQFFSEWGMSYVLWMAGLLTILLIRPKDDRWLLMILFNFLTAIWLTAGSGVSSFQVWISAVVLRMAIWLSIPVYLHLHWVFPQPLGKLSKKVIGLVYTGALVLAIAQWFQLLPRDSYLLGFLVALAGSFILLVLHIVRQPSARRALRLPIVVAFSSLILAVTWQIMYSRNLIHTWFGSVGLLGVPLIPLAYLYSAFRRRLGDLELRVNRFFSIYLFVILLGIVELSLIFLLSQTLQFSGEVLTISLISAAVAAIAFIWIYPAFERFVERRIFGIPLPSKNLLEIFSNRITTSNSLPDLVRVIDEEVIPSLLIRQFAFLHEENGSFRVLSKPGLSEGQITNVPVVNELMKETMTPRSSDPLSENDPYSWIRLILPLRLGEETIGYWLFGRRDPDDLYSQLEIPIIKSLANQAAVALSNILQTERIKAMNEANIDRFEQEKLRLSRDLHDTILNQIATLLMSSDAPVFSPAFQAGFEELTTRLREIVSDLRSPMLDLGLKLAFEDLADKLAERNQDTVSVVAAIQTDGEYRYPEKVESHLYRIVQEACENALKHARAKSIKLTVRLFRDRIELQVEDDGVGFDTGTSLKLDSMIKDKHFGLAGIYERSSLIGAQVYVDSKPGQGTRVRIIWESKSSI